MAELPKDKPEVGRLFYWGKGGGRRHRKRGFQGVLDVSTEKR
jgi:hypothetical protein